MEEEFLIDRAKSGCYSSFDLLVKPYLQPSYKVSYLILNDYNLAQDAIQESLYQAFKSLSKYDKSKASFKTWFNKIVVHMAIKMKRQQFFFFEFSPDLKKETQPSTENNYIIEEENTLICQLVQELSTKLKTVIILFYYQELSIEEIGITLDISEGTVKSRLFKARKKLKEAFIKNNITFEGDKHG